MKSVIAIFSFIFFCGALSSQTNVTTGKYRSVQSFGAYNILADYTGSAADLAHFVEYYYEVHPNINGVSDADRILVGSNLEAFLNEYEDITGTQLTDMSLVQLMAANQGNYEHWVDVRQQGLDHYIVRSIIMNIKKHMNF